MKTVCLFRSLLILRMALPILALGLYGNEADQNKTAAAREGLGADQKPFRDIPNRRPNLRLRQDVSLDYSYVGGATLKSGPAGDLGEQSAHFRYGLKVPLNEPFALRFGLGYRRLDFSVPNGSPLPNNLQTISPSFGADYKLSDQWGVFGAISPRLEMIDNGDHIGSQDFRIGGMLGATYDPSKDLSLRFGVAISPDSLGIPVLPVAGVRWDFARLWTLNVGFPRTSIDYQLLPNLKLSPIKIGFEGGSFHTSKTYGDSIGMTQLNDRRLQYYEIRVGPGANYSVTKSAQIGLTAGAVVYRKFDFKDASYSQEVDPAPYVQLSVKTDF